jgi:hypothetical protein
MTTYKYDDIRNDHVEAGRPRRPLRNLGKAPCARCENPPMPWWRREDVHVLGIMLGFGLGASFPWWGPVVQGWIGGGK